MEGTLPELIDGMEIRRATIGDLPAIVGLMADDSLGSQRERYAEPLPPAYGLAFATIEADPSQELVVATLEGQVVGTLQLTSIPYLSYQGGLRAIVEAVRVASHRRGRGLGGAMMGWAIARARAKGCHTLQLTSNKARTDAHRFYERLGFTASHVGMKLEL